MGGFNQWMIWNSGEEGTKNLDDLPSEGWCKFIYIEPVVLSNLIILRPIEKNTGSLRIQVEYFAK